MSVLTNAKSDELAESLESRCEKWLGTGYVELYRGPSMYGGEMRLLYRHPDDRPEQREIKGNPLCFTIITSHHTSCRRLAITKSSVREINNIMADGGTSKKLVITEWGAPQIVDRAARKPIVYRTKPVPKGVLISSVGPYKPTHKTLTTGKSGKVLIKRLSHLTQRRGYELGHVVSEVPLKLFDVLFKIHETSTD